MALLQLPKLITRVPIPSSAQFEFWSHVRSGFDGRCRNTKNRSVVTGFFVPSNLGGRGTCSAESGRVAAPVLALNDMRVLYFFHGCMKCAQRSPRVQLPTANLGLVAARTKEVYRKHEMGGVARIDTITSVTISMILKPLKMSWKPAASIPNKFMCSVNKLLMLNNITSTKSAR